MRIFLLIFICCCEQTYATWDSTKRVFPDDFKFGVSTAAYQVEGAWNKHYKGETILDHYYQYNNATPDRSNGQIASDSYNRIRQDVRMLHELGVDFYKFSISWARILPTGLTNFHNQDALNYYRALVEELQAYNIEPIITLYYYDLPEPLQFKGGWLNPNMPEWFEGYAAVMFSLFSNRVKKWITINNPAVCFEMYGGKMPPAVNQSGTNDYKCIKNMLLAHAKAYRLYDEGFKEKNKCKCKIGKPVTNEIEKMGIAINLNWGEPYNFDRKHQDITELYRAFSFGMILDPLFSGDFPQVVKDTVKKRSLEQGYTISRMPIFDKEESKLIKNSFDFIGINHQTSYFVREPVKVKNKSKKPKEKTLPNVFVDAEFSLTYGENWIQSVNPSIKAAPFGIYKALIYLQNQYNSPKILITELGAWPTTKGLKDGQRVKVLTEYLKSLSLAVEDSVELMGCAFFTLMDGFDWHAGYTERYGLYEVDFNSEEKNRFPRHSAYMIQQLIHSRTVKEVEEIKFPEGSFTLSPLAKKNDTDAKEGKKNKQKKNTNVKGKKTDF